MKKYLILFMLFSIQAFGQKDSLWTVDQISNMTICLSQKKGSISVIGTGTIIEHNSKFFLLTATHVAEQMTPNPQIVFRVDGDKPAILDLGLITEKKQLNWTHHQEADISIIQLRSDDKNLNERFTTWSFSSKFIVRQKQIPARDNDITFFGFPILDLELKHFSPLSFSAFPASGLITSIRSDTNTKCTFFYLDQPSMQGCSGSAVYCSVKKNNVYMGMGKTLMIGVVHGTANDNTGGKLAAICPSFYIWDLLTTILK